MTSSAGIGDSVIASIDAKTYYMSPAEGSDQARCAISERAVTCDMGVISNLQERSTYCGRRKFNVMSSKDSIGLPFKRAGVWFHWRTRLSDKGISSGRP